MGEELGVSKTESFFVIQDGKAGYTHEGISRRLFQLSCDDALNQGNISLLQRVDRLDIVLSAMEDKALTEPSSSPATSPRATRCPSSLERRCKSTESVLEEVEEKGTLVERVSELEKRVMKLQHIITSSSENVACPAAVQAASSAHPITSHDQATCQNEYDQQSLQDVIDVEKHEVTISNSTSLDHGQHPEPFIYSEKNDMSSLKRESSHMEDHEGMVSSEGASVEEQDSRVYQKQSKKKSLRIKKWLSKSLHIAFPGTPQDNGAYSTGHCWSSHRNPKNCWNGKRGVLHPSSTHTHYGRSSIVEGSP